jgi:uncharacterized membrane protein SpoIIM required for sporulation
MGTAFARLGSADILRAAIGLGICAGMIVQLFRIPEDEEAYAAWAYIGLALISVVLVCMVALKVGFLNWS